MLLEELFESRIAHLYHGTNGMSAARILEENVLAGRTLHIKGNLGINGSPEDHGENVSGVSTTRSRAFAFEWSEVVFELDQARLRQNFRLAPIDFYSKQRDTIKDARFRRNEAEEFVVTPTGIAPLSRYLTAIYMTRATFDELSNDRPVVSRFAKKTTEVRDTYGALLKHPLLHVI